ncbi:hypothetical protein SMMN14_07281 [Sphaerulina musiva]
MGRKKAIPILSPGVDEKLDIQRGFMPGSATISAGWGVNVSAEQPEDFTAPGWTDPLVWLTPLEKSAEGAKSRPRRKTGRKVNIVHDGTDGDESYREETLTEGDDTAHAGDDDDDSYHDETEPNEDNTKIPSRLASRGRVVLKYRATEDRNVAAPSRGTNRGQASGSSALGQGDKTLGRVANLCDVAPENIIPGEGGTSGRRKSKRISKPLHFMQERNVDNDDKDSDDDEESMLPPIEDSRSRRSSIHEGLPDSLSADENEGTADDDDAPETEDENIVGCVSSSGAVFISSSAPYSSVIASHSGTSRTKSGGAVFTSSVIASHTGISRIAVFTSTSAPYSSIIASHSGTSRIAVFTSTSTPCSSIIASHSGTGRTKSGGAVFTSSVIASHTGISRIAVFTSTSAPYSSIIASHSGTGRTKSGGAVFTSSVIASHTAISRITIFTSTSTPCSSIIASHTGISRITVFTSTSAPYSRIIASHTGISRITVFTYSSAPYISVISASNSVGQRFRL